MNNNTKKAKRYDKAFIKLREFLVLCKKCGAKDTVDFLEGIFPKLKENEDGKRFNYFFPFYFLSSQNSIEILIYVEKCT